MFIHAPSRHVRPQTVPQQTPTLVDLLQLRRRNPRRESRCCLHSQRRGDLIVLPRLGKKMRAYWYSEELLSALAVDKNVPGLRGGKGGTRGRGTFRELDKMCALPDFGFLDDKDVSYVDWSSNHGSPWGEGPPKTWWPKERDPNTNIWKEISEEKRTEKVNNAMPKLREKGRCNLDFFETQAESVPVQPTTSSDNASGGSRPDGTSATANSSSAQAGYAVAPGVAQVDRAISPPRDIP